MKTLIKSVAILAVVSLTACGSDTVQEQLEADTWVVATGALSGCDDPTENETVAFNTSPCTSMSGECEYISFAFLNGVATVTTISSDDGDVSTDEELGTYAFDESDNFTLCFDDECNTGTVTVEDDIATLTFLNFDEGCTLVYRLSR